MKQVEIKYNLASWPVIRKLDLCPFWHKPRSLDLTSVGLLSMVLKVKSYGTHTYFVCRTDNARNTSPFCACDERQTLQHVWILYIDEMWRFSQICKKSHSSLRRPITSLEERSRTGAWGVGFGATKLYPRKAVGKEYNITSKNLVTDDFSSWGTQVWTSLTEHWNNRCSGPLWIRPKSS